MEWRFVGYVGMYLLFCYLFTTFLVRKLPNILEAIDPKGESPRDPADVVSRGMILVFMFYVFLAVVMLKVAGVPIDGFVSSVVLIVVGYMMGVFIPTPLPSIVIKKPGANNNQS